MYPNPALDVALGKERKSNQRAVFDRARRSRRRHSKSSILTALVSLLFG